MHDQNQIICVYDSLCSQKFWNYIQFFRINFNQNTSISKVKGIFKITLLIFDLVYKNKNKNKNQELEGIQFQPKI